MPDGKRKRRFSSNLAKRRYYADHRNERFSQLLLSGGLAKILEKFAR